MGTLTHGRRVGWALAVVVLAACSEGPAAPELPGIPLTPGPSEGWVAAGGVAVLEYPPSGGHSCALTPSGGARCWGWNWFGQLGDGWNGNSPVPVAVSGPALRSLTASSQSSCGLDREGGVFCWGDNNAGQLGSDPGTCAGGRPCSAVPVRVPLAESADRVRAGTILACAATRPGSVWCWGGPWLGTNGTGAQAAAATKPVRVLEGGPIDDLAVGAVHACALRFDQVSCWGDNSWGQLGVATGSCNAWPFYRACSRDPVAVSAPVPFVALAAGSYHTCALDAEGRAWCWGRNDLEQLGVSRGFSGTTIRPVATDLRFARLAAGGDRTCGVARDGRAWCWGSNERGQAGTGGASSSVGVAAVQGGHRFLELAVAATHTCGLREDGAVLCWGMRDKGALGDGRTAVADAPSPSLLTGRPVRSTALADAWGCASTPEGDVFCWGRFPWHRPGEFRHQPAPLGNAVPLHGVSVGAEHACALSPSGAAWCWGEGRSGQLGDGGTRSSERPVQVAGGRSFTSISAGENHTCALDRAGAPWCWGENVRHQVDPSAPFVVREPHRVSVVSSLVRLEAGHEMTCGLEADGVPWCWGRNDVGQLGLAAVDYRGAGRVEGVKLRSLSVSRPREGIHGAACGVDVNGRGWCWGRNEASKLGPISGVLATPTPVAAGVHLSEVVVGDHHACGLTPAGELHCWGRNPAGDVAGKIPVTSPEPRRVGDEGGYRSLTLGRDVACAVDARAVLRCWGDRETGLVADGVASWTGEPVEVLSSLRFGPGR